VPVLIGRIFGVECEPDNAGLSASAGHCGTTPG
jgi:hypothetical protein